MSILLWIEQDYNKNVLKVLKKGNPDKKEKD